MADLEDLSPAEVEALLEDTRAPGPTEGGVAQESVQSLRPEDISRLGKESSARLEEVLSTILSREVRVRHVGGQRVGSGGDESASFEGEWFRAQMNREADTDLPLTYGIPAREARILADLMMGRDGTRPPDEIDDVSKKGLLELVQTAQASTAPIYAGLYGETPHFSPPEGTTVPGARLLEPLEGPRILLQRYTYVVSETIPRGKLAEVRVLPGRPSSSRPPGRDRLPGLFDATSDLVFVVNPEDNRIEAANRSTCRQLGYERSRLVSMGIGEVETWSLGEEQWDRYVEEVRGGDQTRFEIELGEGSDQGGRIEVNLGYKRRPEGDRVLGVGRRLEPRRSPEPVEGFNRVDPGRILPEGWMRRFLRRALRQRMREETRFALIRLRYGGGNLPGEQGGDPGAEKIRQILVERVTSHLRPWDLVTRRGTDGFLVLVRGLGSSEDALAVAKRLRSIHRHPVGLGDRRVSTAGHIGVVMDSPERTQPSDFLGAVERLMDQSTESDTGFEIKVEPGDDLETPPAGGYSNTPPVAGAQTPRRAPAPTNAPIKRKNTTE